MRRPWREAKGKGQVRVRTYMVHCESESLADVKSAKAPKRLRKKIGRRFSLKRAWQIDNESF
jgi:hypothetical protein